MGADELIAGLRLLVRRLRADGLNVILGTQTPSKDTAIGFGLLQGSPQAIAARNRVNDWIRTSGVADAVVDFHAALRDPADPDRLRPEYDSGNHLHLSVAGYAAMAAGAVGAAARPRLRAPDRADGQPAARRPGTSTRFRFRAMERHGRLPLGGVTIRFDGERARTARDGRAVIRTRRRAGGRRFAQAVRRRFASGRATVRVIGSGARR